jgi:GMP synthase-like glutamine amidotransferase
MPTVAVIHHLAQPFLGHAAALRDAGLRLDERFRDRGDPLPGAADVDGLLVLGGEESAVAAAGDPKLGPELELLREAVALGRPVLGICLGGQLLASALGGRVRHVGRLVEWRQLRRTEAALSDPLFAGLPDPLPALHFNEDVFDAPPGAVVLAEPAPSGTAAFRYGECAWGLQYHPDADAPVVERWIEEYARYIGDPGGFRAAGAAMADRQAQASAALFGAWARVVQEAGSRAPR